MDTRFRAFEFPPNHARLWNGECVLYDQRCGETHLLQGPVWEILQQLRVAPRSYAELLEHLESSQPEVGAAPETWLKRVLAEFRRHQLVEELPTRDL